MVTASIMGMLDMNYDEKRTYEVSKRLLMRNEIRDVVSKYIIQVSKLRFSKRRFFEAKALMIGEEELKLFYVDYVRDLKHALSWKKKFKSINQLIFK